VTLNTVSASTNLNIRAVVGDVEVLVCISETPHVWTLCAMESSTIDLAMGGSGSGDGLITNGNSTLVFSPVEFGDEGCYQCVPQLQEGSTTFNEVQVTGTLELCVYYMGKNCSNEMLELSDFEGASDSSRTEGLAPGVSKVLLLLGQDQSTLVLGYILLSYDHACAFFWKHVVVE